MAVAEEQRAVVGLLLEADNVAGARSVAAAINAVKGKVEPPLNIEEKQYQYMYNDNEGYHLMDQKTFEQIALSDEQVGDRKNYFQEGANISVLFYNDKPITVDVPTFVVLTIVETQPGLRGDTVTGGSKPAKLETGAVVNIPLHLNEGDKIKVDTRDNSYVERVN